jgi:hypothetical protein
MNRQEIEALPNDPANLKREIIRLSDIVESYEAGKRARALAAQVAASGPAANFEMDVYQMKSDLEGLSDGSIDITDPIERTRILRRAIELLGNMLTAMPTAAA